uniref:Uncharacterized protein n=1 Tax=viral metagenome TaxID=1070528 RepID=A0A6M3J2Q7_9ZZZZ
MADTIELGSSIKTVETPEALKKASDKATQLMDLGALSPEERSRSIAYKSQPYLDQLGKLTDQYNKTMESQGLRFSTERRGKLGEITTEIGRQLGESVYVPMIQQEQDNARANIALGADVGAQVGNIQLQEKQLNQQMVQFAYSHNFDVQKFQEAVRATKAGEVLADKQLAEAVRQFDENLVQTKLEANRTYGLQQRQTQIAELNGAMDRATAQGNATGVFKDPVTGLDYDTLDKQKLELDAKIVKAAYTGSWEEEGSITADDVLDPDQDTGLGDDGGEAGGGEGGGGEGGGGQTATDVLQKASKTAGDMERLQLYDSYATRMGVPMKAVEMVASALDPEDEDSLFTRLAAGTPIPLDELTAMFGGISDPFFVLADFVTLDADGNVVLLNPLPAGAAANVNPGIVRSGSAGGTQERPPAGGFTVVPGTSGGDLGASTGTDVEDNTNLGPNENLLGGNSTAQFAPLPPETLAGVTAGRMRLEDVNLDAFSPEDQAKLRDAASKAPPRQPAKRTLTAQEQQAIAQGQMGTDQIPWDQLTEASMSWAKAQLAQRQQAQAATKTAAMTTFAAKDLSASYPQAVSVLRDAGRMDLEPILYQIRSGRAVPAAQIEALKEAGLNITGAPTRALGV